MRAEGGVGAHQRTEVRARSQIRSLWDGSGGMWGQNRRLLPLPSPCLAQGLKEGRLEPLFKNRGRSRREHVQRRGCRDGLIVGEKDGGLAMSPRGPKATQGSPASSLPQVVLRGVNSPGLMVVIALVVPSYKEFRGVGREGGVGDRGGGRLETCPAHKAQQTSPLGLRSQEAATALERGSSDPSQEQAWSGGSQHVEEKRPQPLQTCPPSIPTTSTLPLPL